MTWELMDEERIASSSFVECFIGCDRIVRPSLPALSVGSKG